MAKLTLVIAGFLSLLAALGFLGLTHWETRTELNVTKLALTNLQTELERTTLGLQGARVDFESDQQRIRQLALTLTNREAEIASLRQEKDAVTHSQKSLEAEFRRAIESRDVTISELKGKLTVDIVDRVLFDTGEAKLKPGGQEVLRKVAAVLAQHPAQQVHVIGHTDNVPIRATEWSRYPSNWELSTARATAAVRFPCEQAGVDPKRLGAVGYGEFRPLAENDTPEGRARNRRIAIVVLSDELVGADVHSVPVIPVPADTDATTNATPEAAPIPLPEKPPGDEPARAP